MKFSALVSTVFCAATFVVTSVATAHAHGGECNSTENDIARLQCFDKAHSKISSPASLSPEEALKKLMKLVNFESAQRKLNLLAIDGPCVIQSSLMIVQSGRTGGSINELSSTSNLALVERVGGWYLGINSGNTALELIYQRGESGSTINTRGSSNIPNLDARNVMFGKQSRVVSVDNDREVAFPLLVEEHLPDKQQIMDAMKSLIASCSN